MPIINNELINNCDRESKIYCRSFNSFQEALEYYENNLGGLDDIDLSSLGLYLCKCVEKEINSSVVQLIRQYLGIEMPRYYCKIDRSFNRNIASVDTGYNNVHHWVYFNDFRDVNHRDSLKLIPLGEALSAFNLLVETTDLVADYPSLSDSRFREIWRRISNLRNQLAHPGLVCSEQELNECFELCKSFLRDYMPGLAVVKKELAPEDWADDEYSIDIEPTIREAPSVVPDGVDTILANFRDSGKPKAGPENYQHWKTLTEIIEKADRSADNYLDLLNARESFVEQFDWFDVPFEENGKYGIKDILGKVVVPARYDDFACLYSIFYTAKVTPAKKGKYYGLVERYSGKELTNFVYDDFSTVKWINNLYCFKKNGCESFGIMTSEGKEVTPCLIDDYSQFNSGLAIRSGTKWGFLSFYYDLYIPPIYDEFVFDDLDKPFIFIINGIDGCVSNEGKFYSKQYLERMKNDPNLKYIEEGDLLMEYSDPW